MKFLSIACLSVLSIVGVAAQHPHERHMERAHPTPLTTSHNDTLTYRVPMIVSENVYPSMFTNVNTIEGEEVVAYVQNENSVAINPRNPRNLIGSAVDYRDNSSTWAYYSEDAGATWKNVMLGKARAGWASSNDPSVCFDHEGRGYLCYGGFNRSGNAQFGENGVFVSVTTDGGRTWNPKHTAVIIHTGQQTLDSAFEDKYYIHADTSSTSPYQGYLYIPWKRVVNKDSSTQIVISRSTDGGATWSVPKNVSNRFPGTSEDTTFGQSFPLARTGPDGSVHLVWNSGTEDAVRYARSTDGGITWTTPVVVHQYKPFGEKTRLGDQVNSRVKGAVRAEAYPTLTIDNTLGARNGWMYLCWSADNYPNVYFSRSTNNGVNWSAPVIVHSDTTNDQFWPWIALDPLNGDVAVMYFDSRDDAANIWVNCYVSYSNDGGTTFTDRRVGDAQNDLRRNPFAFRTFAGDYSGCDFRNGIVYPSWVDMRHTSETDLSDNDVYTAIVNVRAPEAPSTFAATTIPAEPTSIDLSWSGVSKRSFGQPLDTTGARFVLRRDNVEIAQFPLATLAFKDTGLEQYREYFYDLTVVSGADSSAKRNASAYAGGSKLPGIPAIVSARGTTPGDITLDVRTPTKRLDGVTALVNLAKIRVHAGEFQFDIPVQSTDTGKVITLPVSPAVYGWYHLSVVSIDANGNASPSSDTSIIFTGDVTWTEEAFDSMPNFLNLKGAWGLSTFAYSDPTSLTESPAGLYAPSSRDTVILYPKSAFVAIPEHNALVLSWRVAAFVDPGDTMFLETKRGGIELEGEWSVLEWWNSSKETRWQDTAKGDDAWRFGSTVIPLSPDTLLLRLRFRSNVSKNSDGFYIDDIRWETVNGVNEEVSVLRSVFPQPATSHAMIELASDATISHCSVVDIHGSVLHAPWQQSGRTLIVELAAIGSGTYSVTVQRGTSTFITHIVVIK